MAGAMTMTTLHPADDKVAMTTATMVTTTSASVLEYMYANNSALYMPDSNYTGGRGNGSALGEGEGKDCSVFLFVVNFVIVGSMCLLGLAGNTLSIFVLYKDKRNEVAALLLQALAVADNTVCMISFVVLSIIAGLFPFMGEDTFEMKMQVFPYIIKYVHPLGYMSQTACIWVTVLVAANRYIAICRPFDVHRLSAKWQVKIQLLVVTIASILFNLPRFFQVKIVDGPTGPTINQTIIGERTTFGMVYSNILYTVLVLLIPLVALVILNGLLIRELRRMYKRRVGNDFGQSGEENITFIMVIIIAVFIVCHTPDRIYQVLNYTAHSSHIQCGGHLYYAAYCCNIFVIFSSSSNFMIYYVFRKRFRRTLWGTILGWCGKGEHYRRDSTVITENIRLTEGGGGGGGPPGSRKASASAAQKRPSVATCDASKALFPKDQKNGLSPEQLNGSARLLKQ